MLKMRSFYVLASGETVRVIDRAPSGFGVDFDCMVVEGTSRNPRGSLVTLHSANVVRDVIA